MGRVEFVQQAPQSESIQCLRRVDQHEAIGAQPCEEIDLVHQRRVDHYDAVRGNDRLASANVSFAQAAIRHHRGTGPFRAEARERLRVLTLFESSECQQVRSGDNTLAAPAVQSHFEHKSRLLQGRGAELVPKVPAPGDPWHYTMVYPQWIIGWES